MHSDLGRSSLWFLVALLTLLVATAEGVGGKSEMLTEETAAQDLTRLDSRINQLEQRLNLMEISLRSVEQQVRLYTNAPTRSARDQEVILLREEVGALRQRIAELTCGLVRVDERTLSPAAREVRRKGAPNESDPCRLNTSAPLRLSTGP